MIILFIMKCIHFNYRVTFMFDQIPVLKNKQHLKYVYAGMFVYLSILKTLHNRDG